MGSVKAKALPFAHAFSGAENTGRFAKIGHATWIKLFIEADDSTIDAMRKLSDGADVTKDMLSTLASFVCTAYYPKSIKVRKIPELRWHLFCKNMAESGRLPPTLGALKQHI